MKRLVVIQDDDGAVKIAEKEGFVDGTEIIGLLETAKLDLHYDMMRAEEKVN